MIIATVEADHLKLNADHLERAMLDGTPKMLMEAAIELLCLTQLEVPHDEGTLQNSGTIESDGDDVILGYHTPYAARLHEHPEYRFQGGRKGKYIEDPVNNNKQELGIKASNFMRRVVDDATE